MMDMYNRQGGYGGSSWNRDDDRDRSSMRGQHGSQYGSQYGSDNYAGPAYPSYGHRDSDQYHRYSGDAMYSHQNHNWNRGGRYGQHQGGASSSDYHRGGTFGRDFGTSQDSYRGCYGRDYQDKDRWSGQSGGYGQHYGNHSGGYGQQYGNQGSYGYGGQRDNYNRDSQSRGNFDSSSRGYGGDSSYNRGGQPSWR